MQAVILVVHMHQCISSLILPLATTREGEEGEEGGERRGGERGGEDNTFIATKNFSRFNSSVSVSVFHPPAICAIC